MTEVKRQQTTYTLGETIQIELEVSDVSGVGDVLAMFTLVNDSTRSLYFTANGEGQQAGTVVLQHPVTEEVAPGEYQCSYLALSDLRGNQRLINRPDISFGVENVPGDHEGPEVSSWRLVKPH